LPDQKKTIFFHRAHKRAQEDNPNLARLLFVFVALLDVVIFIFFPKIVEIVTYSVKNVLVSLGYYPTVFYWKMLYRPIAALDLPTVYPTPMFAVGMLVFSVVLMIVVIAVTVPHPVSWTDFFTMRPSGQRRIGVAPDSGW